MSLTDIELFNLYINKVIKLDHFVRTMHSKKALYKIKIQRLSDHTVITLVPYWFENKRIGNRLYVGNSYEKIYAAAFSENTIIDDAAIDFLEGILYSLETSPAAITTALMEKCHNKIVNNISLGRLAHAAIRNAAYCGNFTFNIASFSEYVSDDVFPIYSVLWSYAFSLDKLAMFIQIYNELRSQVIINAWANAPLGVCKMVGHYEDSYIPMLEISKMAGFIKKDFQRDILSSQSLETFLKSNNMSAKLLKNILQRLALSVNRKKPASEDNQEKGKKRSSDYPEECKSTSSSVEGIARPSGLCCASYEGQMLVLSANDNNDETKVPKLEKQPSSVAITGNVDDQCQLAIQSKMPAEKLFSLKNDALLYGDKDAAYRLEQYHKSLDAKPASDDRSVDVDAKPEDEETEEVGICLQEADFWRRRAALLGHEQARYELAEQSFCRQSYDFECYDQSVFYVPARAEFWLKHMSGCKHPEVSYLSGMFQLIDSNKPDAMSISLLRDAAKDGHPQALYVFALCHICGFGIPKDEQSGVRLLKMSAQKDNNPARYLLGKCLEHGIGVEKSPQSAIECYRSINDIPDALYSLGKLLHNQESIALYSRAAEQGHIYAEYEVVNDILAHWDNDPSPSSLPVNIGYVFKWLIHMIEIVRLNTCDNPFKFHEPLFSQQILRVWDKLSPYRNHLAADFWMDFLRTFNNTAQIFKPKRDRVIDRLKGLVMHFERILQVGAMGDSCRVPELAWFVGRKMKAMPIYYGEALLKDDCSGNWAMSDIEMLNKLAWPFDDPTAQRVLPLELFLRGNYRGAKKSLRNAESHLQSNNISLGLQPIQSALQAISCGDENNLESYLLEYIITGLHINKETISQIQKIQVEANAPSDHEAKVEANLNGRFDVISLFSLMQWLLIKLHIGAQQQATMSVSNDPTILLFLASEEGAGDSLAVSPNFFDEHPSKDEQSDSKAEAVQSTIRDASWSTIDSSSLSSSATSRGSFFSTPSSSSSNDSREPLLVPSVFNKPKRGFGLFGFGLFGCSKGCCDQDWVYEPIKIGENVEYVDEGNSRTVQGGPHTPTMPTSSQSSFSSASSSSASASS